MEPIRLDIGCGPEPTAGYIGVDLYVDAPGVIKAPMHALPYEDETVDEIYCSHALEHVGKYEVVPILTEWWRVLKYNGYLTIEVPDLGWVLRNWLRYPDNGWNMDAIFGDQSTPGQYHKTGFTRPIMYGYLEQAGFAGRPVDSGVIFSHEQDCLVFTVQK